MSKAKEQVSPIYFREGNEIVWKDGMTKREHFALACLQGYLSSGRKEAVLTGGILPITKAAVVMADELLKELAK